MPLRPRGKCSYVTNQGFDPVMMHLTQWKIEGYFTS